MELSENKLKCLLNGDNLNSLSEENFYQIMQIALSHVCGKLDNEALKQLQGSEFNIIEKAHSDIVKLFIETVRSGTSSEELNSLLRGNSLSKDRAGKLCEFYTNHKDQLQENLESIGNSLPHIIDVDWHLDYCTKTSTSNPAGILNYAVSFSTMKHGSIRNVKFNCTMQQLQELVQKLKDAMRHTEKLTNL